jgi:hypothetical protein
VLRTSNNDEIEAKQKVSRKGLGLKYRKHVIYFVIDGNSSIVIKCHRLLSSGRRDGRVLLISRYQSDFASYFYKKMNSFSFQTLKICRARCHVIVIIITITVTLFRQQAAVNSNNRRKNG